MRDHLYVTSQTLYKQVQCVETATWKQANFAKNIMKLVTKPKIHIRAVSKQLYVSGDTLYCNLWQRRDNWRSKDRVGKKLSNDNISVNVNSRISIKIKSYRIWKNM